MVYSLNNLIDNLMYNLLYCGGDNVPQNLIHYTIMDPSDNLISDFLGVGGLQSGAEENFI